MAGRRVRTALSPGEAGKCLDTVTDQVNRLEAQAEVRSRASGDNTADVPASPVAPAEFHPYRVGGGSRTHPALCQGGHLFQVDLGDVFFFLP